MGRLRVQFGLTRNRVVTLEEERNLTDFIVIVDHVISLFQSWQNFRPTFLGNTNNFLGTQLVLLQRSLAGVAESVLAAGGEQLASSTSAPTRTRRT